MIKLKELDELLLKNKLNDCFVKKDLKDMDSRAIAALITAVSKMANISEIIGEIETMDELIDLYQVEKETEQLIGMAPQYVQSSIGYSIDFNDYGASKKAYDGNKSIYDEIYIRIYNRSKERNAGRQM